MKRIALCVLAAAMLLATSNLSQAGDCNSCCSQTSCFPKLSLPKMNFLKSLFSMGCKSKCEPSCATPAPVEPAPAATPAPVEAAPAPKPPAELSPSAADKSKGAEEVAAGRISMFHKPGL